LRLALTGASRFITRGGGKEGEEEQRENKTRKSEIAV
jgi:hypothetical protein